MAPRKKTKTDNDTPFDNDEEGAIVADNKRIRVRQAEQKIMTSEYMERELTAKEEESASSLQAAMQAMLTKNDIHVNNDEVAFTIPTGIDVLDTILGGGITSKLTQIVGAPGTGKSALAAKIIASGERKWPGKFSSIYIDTEHAMTKVRLNQLGAMHSTIVNYLSVEGVFKLIESTIQLKIKMHAEDDPTCIIWDSIPNTPTEKGLVEENLNALTMARAVILNHLLPRWVPQLDKYNIALVCINQLRDKVEMGGPYQRKPATLKFMQDQNLPGGYALHYNSIQLIRLFQKELVKEDAYGFSGVAVKCVAVKNKLFTPNVPIECIFRFDKGYDNIWSNYEYLKECKKIDCGGGWVRLISFPDPLKFRQKEFETVYKDNKAFRDCFNQEVERTLKENLIDKYSSGDAVAPPLDEDDVINLVSEEDVVEEEAADEYDFAAE